MRDRETCPLCGKTEYLITHHVLGRIGHFKHAPYNLIRICNPCHHRWHNNRTDQDEDRVYRYMRENHGDQFPMQVNGYPYFTKWLLKAMEREEERNAKLQGRSQD